MKDPGLHLARRLKIDSELRNVLFEYLGELRSNFQKELDAADEPKMMFRLQGRIQAIEAFIGTLDEFMALPPHADSDDA